MIIDNKNCKYIDDISSILHLYNGKPMQTGKSMCISEVHGGAGLGCGPASAHYIAEQVLGYGFFKVVQKQIISHPAHNLS